MLRFCLTFRLDRFRDLVARCGEAVANRTVQSRTVQPRPARIWDAINRDVSRPPAAVAGCTTMSGKLAAVALLAAVAVTATGCQQADPTPPAASVEASEVKLGELQAEVTTLEPQIWPVLVRCQGSLFADEDSAIGARVSGRAAQVHVDLGDRVRAGDPLVTLETDEFELRVAQATAELEQARSAVGLLGTEINDSLDPETLPAVRQQRAVWDEAIASLERAENLLAQRAISQGEFDIIASAQRVAEARFAEAVNLARERLSLIGVRRVELQLAQQQLAEAVIRAPFDGQVKQRNLGPGTYVSAGDAVVSLVRTNPMWYRGTISERYSTKLAVGQQVTIQPGVGLPPVVAHVTRISPSIDLASRSIAFEAILKDPGEELLAGLFATAEVVLDDRAEALVLPDSAVLRFAGTEKVWKVVDGVAQSVEVSTGTVRDGWAVVQQGLSAGDQVLTDASSGRTARVVPLPANVQVAENPAVKAASSQ